MFSGIGGFELGIEYDNLRPVQSESNPISEIHNGTENKLQQWECVGYSEIDKYAIQIYERHFNHKNYGDATKIKAEEIPDFDLLVGGFPCQAFSIAGKRGGLDDTRGTLFYDIARIAKEKQPQHLLLENVKGLLSHDDGRTFKLILSTFAELGYNLEWQVFNSKNFGVPQNRERVFIIGHLGACCGREVFPLRQDDGTHPLSEGGVESETKPASAITTREGGRKENNFVINVVGTLDEGTWAKRNESIRRVYGTDGLAPTIPTGTGGGVMPKISIPVLTPNRPEKRQNGRRFKEDGEPSFTLNTQDRHGVYDGYRIRRLTPTECERLQAYPDGWTKEVSDTQRYKTLGNGVTTNVVEEIIKRLYEFN